MKNNPPISGLERPILPTEVLVFQADLRGIITYANGVFAQINGYTIKELIGASHEIVRHPDVPGDVIADMRRTLELGRVWRGILKNRCKNGDHYWIDAIIIPVRKHGAVYGYRSVYRQARPKDIAAAEKRFKRRSPPRLLPCLPPDAAVAGAAVLLGVVLLATVIMGALGLAHSELVMSEFRRLSMDDQVARAVLPRRAEEEWLLNRDLRITDAPLIALALGGIAAGLMLLQNGVLRPVRERVADWARMAKDKLSTRVDAGRHGDIKGLNRSAAAVQAQFQRLIDRIRQGGELAANQAGTLKHIVSTLVDSSEEQHDRVYRVVDDILDAKRTASVLAKRIEDLMNESACAIAGIERHAKIAGTGAGARSRLRRLTGRLDDVLQAILAEGRVLVVRTEEIEHEMRQVANWLVDHRGAMHELGQVADCLADAGADSRKSAEGFESRPRGDRKAGEEIRVGERRKS